MFLWRFGQELSRNFFGVIEWVGFEVLNKYSEQKFFKPNEYNFQNN